ERLGSLRIHPEGRYQHIVIVYSCNFASWRSQIKEFPVAIQVGGNPVSVLSPSTGDMACLVNAVRLRCIGLRSDPGERSILLPYKCLRTGAAVRHVLIVRNTHELAAV